MVNGAPYKLIKNTAGFTYDVKYCIVIKFWELQRIADTKIESDPILTNYIASDNIEWSVSYLQQHKEMQYAKWYFNLIFHNSQSDLLLVHMHFSHMTAFLWSDWP